jgi:hypothetical protein
MIAEAVVTNVQAVDKNGEAVDTNVQADYTTGVDDLTDL